MGEPPLTLFEYMETLNNPAGGPVRLVVLSGLTYPFRQAKPATPQGTGRDRFMAAQEAANRDATKPDGSLVALGADSGAAPKAQAQQLRGMDRFLAAQERENQAKVKQFLEIEQGRAGTRKPAPPPS